MIITIGDSKGITLPKSWIEIIEQLTKKELKEVAMEINSVLTIIPLIDGMPVKVEILPKIKENNER